MKKIIIPLALLILVIFIFGCTNSSSENELIGTWEYEKSEGTSTSLVIDKDKLTFLQEATVLGYSSKFDIEFDYNLYEKTIQTTGGKIIYYNQTESFAKTINNPYFKSVTQEGENVIAIYKDTHIMNIKYEIFDNCVLDLNFIGQDTFPSTTLVLLKKGCILPPGNPSQLFGTWIHNDWTLKITENEIINNSGLGEETFQYAVLNKYFIEVKMPEKVFFQNKILPYKIEGNTLTFDGVVYTKK